MFTLQGNIEELIQIDLGNRAAAAVEDCSQTFETYFDFNELAKIQARPEKPTWVPTEPIKPDACVFNRGVLVIDTNQWIKQQVTEAILWWMDEFQSAESVLYKYGFIWNPAFFLIEVRMYKNLKGLGRMDFFSLV